MGISASSANDEVIITKYCKSEEVAVNLSNSSSQCGFNHSGILWDGSQPVLSLALVSSQCCHFSNIYLVLIAHFAIGGIALHGILH